MSTNFRRGGAVAEEASKSATGSRFSNWEYFSIKDEKDPTRIVRFITDVDEWITTSCHPNMPTRPAPAGYKGKWPTSMGSVCRMDKGKDPVTGVVERTFPEHEDCYHCITPQSDGQPRRKNERTWGLGILREEYIENGQKFFRDQVRKVTVTKDDGTTEEREAPAYVLFQQAWSNFWGSIQGVADMRGTCLDRDFRITRKGFTMNDTDYLSVPYDPVFVDFGQGKGPQILDFRDAEVKALYPDMPDLGEIVSEQASDHYYDRFFDVRHPQPAVGKDEKAAAATTVTGVTTPVTEPTAAALGSIAQRVSGLPGMPAAVAQGYGANAGAVASTGAAVAAPVPAPQPQQG